MPRLKNINRKLDRYISTILFKYFLSRKLFRYKGKFNGERCFIIGNGPSLTVHDLERLKLEYTFATNRIYHVYDKTDWRPSFYCVQDFILIQEIFKDRFPRDLAKIDSFFAISLRSLWRFSMKRIDKKFFYLKAAVNVAFSKDIMKCIYEGKTVTYSCMQLARYMGFDEIILLGVDHSSSLVMRRGGQIEVSNSRDYTLGIRKRGYTKRPYERDFVEQSYTKASDISQEEGWKILNATRGGNLDLFPKTSLDSLKVKK